MILETKSLSKKFGGLQAISMVDFSVEEGEIRGLIGPNGAGKTTFFNLVSGYHKPSSGDIILAGENINKFKPNQIAKLGLVRTFQETTLFHEMTVQQNVSLGFHLQIKSTILSALLHTPSYLREQEELSEKATELLKFMGIGDLKDEVAKNLPHGHQRALAIAIALAAKPKVLLLDEPVTGMNPKETAVMVERIRKIRDEMGITIVLVEHDMKAVMGLSDRLTVLSSGKKIAEGSPQEVIQNEEVIKAYLGTEED
ncbi:MAG: hypothetical protein B1H11_02225 [Desulfobacteraceae bacterium 4484_190.1]|nr:MAG: hypothetical protein B1H11_02225 [Desulfobacteraceae bacterium 4484_190.1]